MEPFVYEALPVRVIFGSGTVTQLKAEAERLGVRRVLVLSTPGRGEVQANEIAALLGERSAGVHAGAVMHTPVAVTERALHRLTLRAIEHDPLPAAGRGSDKSGGRCTRVLTRDRGAGCRRPVGASAWRPGPRIANRILCDATKVAQQSPKNESPFLLAGFVVWSRGLARQHALCAECRTRAS